MFTHSLIRPLLILALACMAALTPPDAQACRIILPPHPHPPMPRPAPLSEMQVKQHRVSIDIRDQVARVTVRAVFHNPNGRRIEGTYYFPIGQDAAINSFTMTVNGKTMEAELLPADKARQIYEDIVRRQKDPAILEYIDHGMLRARVFPIEPQSDVTIELSYDQAVVQDGPLARFRYPLISARPQDGPIQSLVVEATLNGKTPLKTVFVPGYEVSVNRPDDRQARIGFEATNVRPDRDFEIVFSRQPGRVGIDVLPFKKGDDGYFMMLISPRSELQQEEIVAKDITFVIDTSGSMQGDNIQQAKEALRFCIQSLNPTDHFNVISFATEPVPLSADSLPVNDANIAKALAFVDDMRARGGTAINDALAMAIGSKRAAEKVPIIVFLTDGLPTIGEIDPATILKQMDQPDLPRLFTFGVGNGVNTRLLNSLAQKGHGHPTYVRPQEDLEIALSSFYERIASPVMTDLQLDTGDLKLSQLNPPTLPDLFRGSQILLTGRYTGDGTHTITLSGAVGDAREKIQVDVDLSHDALNSYVPRIWATQRIGYLQEQIQLNGEQKELIEEIQTLSREFGIVSRYSSYLIVEEGMETPQLRQLRDELRSREAEMDMDSGAGAVDDAASTQLMKQAPAPSAAQEAGAARSYMNMGSLRRGASGRISEDANDAEVLRHYVVTVEDRTFYRRAADGYLYDSQIPKGETPKPDVSVEAWSDAFFDLLKTYPALRHYLRAGSKFYVILDGKTIQVTD